MSNASREITTSARVEKPGVSRNSLIGCLAVVAAMGVGVLIGTTVGGHETAASPKPAETTTTTVDSKQLHDYYDNQNYLNSIEGYVYSHLLKEQSEVLPVFRGTAIITYTNGSKVAIYQPILLTDQQVGLSSPASQPDGPTEPLAVISVNPEGGTNDEFLDVHLSTDPLFTIEYVGEDGHTVSSLDAAGFGTDSSNLFATRMDVTFEEDHYALTTDKGSPIGRFYAIS